MVAHAADIDDAQPLGLEGDHGVLRGQRGVDHTDGVALQVVDTVGRHALRGTELGAAATSRRPRPGTAGLGHVPLAAGQLGQPRPPRGSRTAITLHGCRLDELEADCAAAMAS
jgi:hypothetical protein